MELLSSKCLCLLNILFPSFFLVTSLLVSAGQSLNPSNAESRIFIQFGEGEWEGTRSVFGREEARGLCRV